MIWKIKIVTPQGQAKCRGCGKQMMIHVECVQYRDSDFLGYMHKECFEKFLAEEKRTIEEAMKLDLNTPILWYAGMETEKIKETDKQGE